MVVEFCVDECDVKASRVEELGEAEHGVDVALGWKRDAHCVRFVGRVLHD